MCSDYFIKLVTELNEKSVDYVVLDNKLSDKRFNHIFLIKKDDYVSVFEKCLLNRIVEKNNEKYWYGASKPQYWLLKNGDLITVYKQIVVRSMTLGIWIPIDKIIQKSAFENKTKLDIKPNTFFYELSDVDKIVYIVSNAVFTSKVFSEDDISFILDKIKEIDIKQLEIRLDKVFFKYTENLIRHLINGTFDNILQEYLRYKDY